VSKIYVETSALLVVILRQEGYESIIKYLESSECCTSSLTFVEARRSLVRLVRSYELKENDHQLLLGKLIILEARWSILEITKEIQNRAGGIFPKEPVRTLDAIHLATALEFIKIYGAVEVLSRDQRIVENLEGLGLREVF
jgi:predicted nucleic acid-binding protein